MEHSAKKYVSQLEALYAATVTLTEKLPLNTILDKLLRSLQELVPYDSASILLLGEDSSVTILARRGFENIKSKQDNIRQFLLNFRLSPARLAALKHSTIVDDTTTHPDWQQVSDLSYFRNWIGIPLIVEGKPIGVFSLDKAVPGFFTKDHLRLAEMMAAPAAAAIRYERLQDQVQEQAERLTNRISRREQTLTQQYQRQSTLAELKIALHQPQELQAVLDQVVHAVTRLMPASDASIILWDEATDTFTTSASSIKEQPKDTPIKRVRSREGATYWIVKNQQQLVVPNIHEDRFGPNQMLTEYGYQAYAGVPLLTGDTCLGVLYTLDHDQRPYQPHDISFLGALANQAAAAIYNVRLFQKLRANQAQLDSIISHAPVILFALDADGFITFSRGQALDTIGLNSDTVVGQHYEKIFGGFPAIVADIARALGGKFLHTTIEGLKNAWDVKYSPFFDKFTEVNSIIVVATDVTELRQAEIAQTKLHEQTRKILARTEALYAVARSLVAVSDLTILLQTIVDNVTEVLPANRTALYILNMVSQQVEDFVIGGPGADKNHIAPFGDLMEGLTGWALRESKPALSLAGTSDSRESVRIQQRRLAHRAGSIIVVPLQYRDQQIGTISAVRLPDEPNFTEEDVTLMVAMANQVSAAIQTSYLYREIRQNVKDLEERVAQRTEALTVANRRLLEIGKLRTKYMHDVSHELRTPLTTLKLYLKLLESGQPEKKVQYIQVLKETYKRFENLVEGVLRLSRIHVNNDALKFTPVDLNSLGQNLAATYKNQALEKRIALEFEPAAEEATVLADLDQLREGFSNLIVNAIGYTTEGGVTIRVLAVPDKKQTKFEVSDSGFGISATDALHIFDPFYRGEQVSQSTIPGMGIGLTILKEIVEIHHGDIAFNSEPGVGTTFSVSLPNQPV
jgi:signal transduction histidine kinase/PAS domain-containing protein